MKKTKSILHQSVIVFIIGIMSSFTHSIFAGEVGITADLMDITVKHNGKDFKIERDQDITAEVDPTFAKTSRPCPPFCIFPMKIAEGVETVGELEVIDYLKRMNAGENILVIDSRTQDWVSLGVIPGAINLPWTKLNPKKGATTEDIMTIMQTHFNVTLKEDVDDIAVDEAIVSGDTTTVFNFSKAKTLVMYCNGMWCGQSPNNIKNLLKFGYPAEKIKWYRGGMQNWSNLGLSVVKKDPMED